MSDGTYVGAIDQGTTGTRFLAFDRSGRVRAQAYERHEQRRPGPGLVEHDPVEIWHDTQSVVRRALDESDVAATDLAAIGIANQRETTVLWDAETGTPVHDAIGWQDRRTTDRIDRIVEAGDDEWIREVTGLVPDAYFSATKAEWLLDNAGATDLRDRAADGDLLLGTIDAWLIYNLTGEHVTDVSNAAETMLFDVRDLEWSDDLLAEFGVPEAVLPTVRPSSDETPYGYTDPDGFLGAEVPVCAALGDQQAALFGQACFEEGDTKNTYGTGSFLMTNTGSEFVDADHGLLSTVGFQLSGESVTYTLEGPIFEAGTALEWLDDVSLVDRPSETAELAASVDSTGGVYFVPSFTGIAAPFWDDQARGTIVGMTRDTRREHVARATLEAIAYRTRDVVEAMAGATGFDLSELRVDGGMAKNNFLCQLQANLLQSDVVRPRVDETTALGAAYAAGLAVDYWDSLADLRDNWRVEGRFSPEIEAARAEERYDGWTDAVARALDGSGNG